MTFAWNHGGIAPEIANTWIGLVGPGVRNLRQDDTTWTDHTDLRRQSCVWSASRMTTSRTGV